jgi:hypothetical protein
MGSADSKTAANHKEPACTLDVLAGAPGKSGHVDGPLPVGRLSSPTHVCLYGASLIVADYGSHTIRLIDIDGVGGRTGAAVAALIVDAAPILPKELAAIIAEYMRSAGMRTIAGIPRRNGLVDGPALTEAKFKMPFAVAVDDTDPVAGPQLIISDYGNHCIRCLNFRSEQVSTLAGDRNGKFGHANGPAHAALFYHPNGLAVAPSGVIFVAEQVRTRHALSNTRAHCCIPLHRLPFPVALLMSLRSDQLLHSPHFQQW